MSKPLNEEIFIEFKSDLAERKNEVLLQVLELLETFRSDKNEKMARISSELTEILENEENLEKILNILIALNEDKMIKVYEDSYLKEKFPNVMVDKFLK
ncbi:hypothetical protein FOH62_08725 [Campylobacter coli]|nr:hypothetical protein [Campylobacter coli]